MRVLIVADMEGVSGITVWEQVLGGQAMYEEGRQLYTAEINAAVQGCQDAGATEILVVDCHGAGGPWNFNTLIPEQLHPACEWLAHHAWSRYYEALEQPYDACVLVGMHSKAGTPDGVMCHTISTTGWEDLLFNETSVGEIGIHAAMCGHFGCPIVAVTGDVAACREARALLGDTLVTVPVKRGLTRYSARHIVPVNARALIRDGVCQALRNRAWPTPYVPARPTRITIRFASVDSAADYLRRHGVVAQDHRTAIATGETWLHAWNSVWMQ